MKRKTVAEYLSETVAETAQGYQQAAGIDQQSSPGGAADLGIDLTPKIGLRAGSDPFLGKEGDSQLLGRE